MRRYLLLLIFVLCLCFTSGAEARKLALLVGVDKYDDISSLTCCVNDMNTLKKALMKIGFAEENIHLLVTRGENIDYPTKRRIERRISEILSSAGPSDLVFIAFSGHGAQEGKTVYFCPPEVDLDDLEGTCVSITKVMENLALCKAKFKWMVVDACRNDPTRQAKGIGGKGIQVIPSPPEGISLFQSCAKDEESWEDADSGNSFFTKNFAAALSGEADSDHDGILTLMEVCKWTTAQTKSQVMTTLKKSQKPYISGSVSDFILTKDLNVPKAKALAREARNALDNYNFELAVEKYDEALALCPQFDAWRRDRDLASNLLKKELERQEAAAPQLQPTSRYSFEWDGTKITKYIGNETNVVIPKGATEIGEEAFKGCSSLKSVVIPEGVTVIGAEAFASCKSIKSIVIPKGVTKIGEKAFYSCDSLTSVVIHEGLTKIEKNMFQYCRSLKSVTIPGSVREIGCEAFLYCTALKEWILTSSSPYFEHRYLKSDGIALLTKDGKKLIACPGASGNYRIPDGVSVIGDRVFQGCDSLTSVIIPEGVTRIDEYAFFGTDIKSVTLPEGVKEIGRSAFCYCQSLTSIKISRGVKLIGDSAFHKCTSLKTVVIPEGVVEIEENAFQQCSSLTSVVIGEGLTKIGKYAFSYCRSLKSIDMPNSVTEIGESAFYECSSLLSVAIPEGLTKIEFCAFHSCSSLTSVVIPDGVTVIGSAAFDSCSSLKTVEIPQTVKSINNDAFEGCSSLRTVTIPESVTYIGPRAFSDCSSLTSVVIPEGVTKIEALLFFNCSSLTSVKIPDRVTTIEKKAFYRCTSLSSIVIPESVKIIGSDAFDESPKVTIYAPAGSEAEKYAKEHKIPFQAR